MEPTRILIAEDDHNSAMILSRILSRAGFPESMIASSGKEAVELVRTAPPDIIISDIGMPGEIDGIQAAEIISREHALPIIFITGYSDKDTIDRAKKVAPAAYILKPFKKEEVLIAIEMALYKARTDRQLRASQRIIRMMAGALASINDGVLITDVHLEQDGPHIIYANKAFETITGYTTDEVIGKTLNQFNGPRTETHHLAKLRQRIEAQSSHSWETTYYRKDRQKFTGHWIASPIHEENGQAAHLIFVLRDVTTLRELEESQRQSQKIEAIGRFTGGIAHDFNNLLAVINSYSDLLKLKIDPDSPYIRYIDNIRNAGQRGTDLVAQLMTFSRRRATTPIVMDLVKATRETEKMLRRLIRENIQIKTTYAKTTPHIRANPGQIEQVLVNLCVNARDAIPESGTITIAIANVEVSQPQNSATGEMILQGPYVMLSVSDTGTGMSDSIRQNIFDPFFTTKDVGKGTGLGLSTVYGILKQSNAFIKVDSQLGKGSTFAVYFPAITEENPDSHDTLLGQVDPRDIRGTETILVVEDDTNFADSVNGILQIYGYTPLSAASAKEALDNFSTHADDIDLLITDIVLPDLSGRDLAARLLELKPTLKIIFMTGYDNELNHGKTFPTEAITLQKPFSLNTLLSRIRQQLDTTKASS